MEFVDSVNTIFSVYIIGVPIFLILSSVAAGFIFAKELKEDGSDYTDAVKGVAIFSLFWPITLCITIICVLIALGIVLAKKSGWYDYSKEKGWFDD